MWELSLTEGRFGDGSVRRVYGTVKATSESEAHRELAAFVADKRGATPRSKALRDINLDDAIERYLTEHLSEEKGRADKTIEDYRGVHARWFSPELGKRLVRDIDEAAIDRAFGRMRKAGLSRSRMNQAKSLYAPFFRWAKSRRIISRSPMADFELPTSRHVSKERVPPEAEELSLLLAEALIVIPDVAPLLTLGAVTGMRRGELVGALRSGLRGNILVVDTAIDEGRRVKATKTRRARKISLDDATVAMLERHCQLMDERAAMFGTTVPPDGYLFSNAPDCSVPMPPDYATKQVAKLKDHLGIPDKRPETVVLEDQALAVFRTRPQLRTGMTGPAPSGGMSYRTIGERLGRSERWAALAVAAAERREQAQERGLALDFDGSIVALRKFTSSELLDAGFNISMVAQRQGHGPQVLMKHYSKSRRSAERKAAEHLGRVVHGS